MHQEHYIPSSHRPGAKLQSSANLSSNYSGNQKQIHFSKVPPAAKTNTNSCQASNLANATNVAPAHSSINYCQIFGHHLIEETLATPMYIYEDFMLHRAINYLLSVLGYFLVCSAIGAVIIDAVKHQKVTKVLNK